MRDTGRFCNMILISKSVPVDTFWSDDVCQSYIMFHVHSFQNYSKIYEWRSTDVLRLDTEYLRKVSGGLANAVRIMSPSIMMSCLFQ